MKQALVAEQASLQKELGATTHADKEGGHEDYEANFPDYGRNDEDNAAEMADYQAASSTARAVEERLDEVKAALQRIQEGTYGVTQDGEVIPEDRLRANPAATTVIKK